VVLHALAATEGLEDAFFMLLEQSARDVEPVSDAGVRS
jgi:hypothetical protein